MDHITIGQAAGTLALIVAILTGCKYIAKSIKDFLAAEFKEYLKPIEDKQKDIMKRLDMVDLENCKNYLVTFLSEVGRGEQKDETERQRFWEQLEHYQSLGGNSYVLHRVNDLKRRDLL